MSSRRVELLEPFCKEFVPAQATDKVTIYFLLWRGEIAYVGQTTNLGQRLGPHRTSVRRKVWLEPRPLRTSKFDRVLYFEVPAADGDAYEGALIRNFNPRWARRAPADSTRDQEILAALGLPPNVRAQEAFLKRARRQRLAVGRRTAETKRRYRAERELRNRSEAA